MLFINTTSQFYLIFSKTKSEIESDGFSKTDKQNKSLEIRLLQDF